MLVQDRTTTDADGNFTLTVGVGTVTLVFETANFNVSIEIKAPEASVITIVVTLEPDEVVVDDLDVKQEPIRCDSGRVSITKGDDSDFIIDGGGEACILAEGSCEVNLVG